MDLRALVAISTVTGHPFEISADGVDRGIPLPATWFHAPLFTAIGGALWFAGRRWDAPGFVALLVRRRWLVPVISVFLILPASLALIFVLVR